MAWGIDKWGRFFICFIRIERLVALKERALTKKTVGLFAALTVIVLLLAVPFLAGPAKAFTAVHETVDIKVDSAAVCILVTNPASGEQAGYTSLTGSEIDTFSGSVWAVVISPQEVQLCSANGFEGDNAIDFNILLSDPPATFTLTVTHIGFNGNDVWGPKTWSGTISPGQSYTAQSGIDVNGYVKGSGEFFVAPEYALGGLLALAASLTAFVLFKKRQSLPLFKKY